MKRSLLFFVVLIAAGIPVFGQTKTVTNADLEKFRQERLKAEAEYRANYARWGFPSPEERDRQREQNLKEAAERIVQARSDALEQERIDLERRRLDAEFNYSRSPIYVPVRSFSSPYFINYAPYGFYYSRPFRPRTRVPVPGFGNFGGQKVRPGRSYLPPFVGGTLRH
jgi:hypothetical protein